VHGHCLPLHGRERHTSCIKLGGIRLVLRSAEHVSLLSPTNAGETGVLQHPLPLCFQQSTGNSATPEVYVVLCILRDLLVDDDVRDLDPPSGLEYPVDLLHDRHLIRAEVDDTVADDDID
jgi:hypothetical protein